MQFLDRGTADVRLQKNDGRANALALTRPLLLLEGD
jgi:hypothetical protein